ncbi:MAG: SRPBCC family protein [Nocardioidaceae bacterium]
MPATAQSNGDQTPLANQLGLDRLIDEATDLGVAMADRGVSSISHGIDSLTDRLNSVATGGIGGTAMNAVKGDPKSKAKLKAGATYVKERVGSDSGKGGVSALKEKIGGLFKSGSDDSSGGKKLKVTNIVEAVDVPVDRSTAYELWTQFEQFPSFMKKVENVNQKSDQEVEWTAQVFWSHRSWTAKIVDQVPNDRIVWRSKGDKGHVDGAVTFHELAPNLTRVLVTLEYHPRGFFEHTGNIWRAQGRRARLELKHYRRHVSTQTLIHQDEVDGWTGEIHKGKVTKKDASKSGSSRSGGGKKGSSSKAKKGSAKKSGSNGSGSARKTTKSSSSSSGKKATASRKKTAASSKKTAASSKKTAASRKTTSPARKRTTATRKTTKKRAPAKQS